MRHFQSSLLAFTFVIGFAPVAAETVKKLERPTDPATAPEDWVSWFDGASEDFMKDRGNGVEPWSFLRLLATFETFSQVASDA